MSQQLRLSTSIRVVIGPAVDATDGFTPETTLTLSSADVTEIMKHNETVVTDISGATFAAITGMDGYYNLTLTAAFVNTLGQLTIAINDDSLIRPIKQTFMVMLADEWDALYSGDTGYWAKLNLIQDTVNDEYTVNWIKQATVLTSGVTSPQIQVIRRADGTNLIDATAMAQIGSTGYFKYDEPDDKIVDGEAVVVVLTATIGGATRTWVHLVGRDV